MTREHGFSLRHRSADVENRDENRSWVAFAYDPEGAIIGAMTFRITGYEGRMEVSSFLVTTAAAKYLLLDWIGRHADQVKQASVRVNAADFAELWVRDLGETISTADAAAWAAPMGRVIDVRGLSGIGAGDGEIVLQVVDDHAPWNTGVFRIAGRDGKLSVEEQASATPEATITIQGLSSLVFTGQNPEDFPFRGWGDPDAAAQAKLRSIFPFVSPFLFEEF
jgi:predicted acetyltransferase